jgi:aldehyde dehydrogenase (NAD+)
VAHLVGAIAHGNTVVIVPDESMPLPALDLYEIFDTSDMPPGVVNILTGNKHHLTRHLCEHQNLNALWYLYDVNEKKEIKSEEILSLQFIRYTSNFNLKRTWFTANVPQLNQDNSSLNRAYLNEIGLNATQSKLIHVPMGTIFAN